MDIGARYQIVGNLRTLTMVREGCQVRTKFSLWLSDYGVSNDRPCSEFCYAIRYIVQNGRSTGPSWSMRQSAVYQQFDTHRRSSTWILLQPSADAQRRFNEIQRDSVRSTNPMIFHVAFLFSTMYYWKDYITSIRAELDALVICLVQL